jgi:hypothetical protein
MNMMRVQNFEIMCDKFRQTMSSSRIMVLMINNLFTIASTDILTCLNCDGMCMSAAC